MGDLHIYVAYFSCLKYKLSKQQVENRGLSLSLFVIHSSGYITAGPCSYERETAVMCCI